MIAIRRDIVNKKNQACELIIKDPLFENQLASGPRHLKDGALEGAVGIWKNEIGESQGDQPSKPRQQGHWRNCLIETDASSLHGGEFIVMRQSGEGEKNGHEGGHRNSEGQQVRNQIKQEFAEFSQTGPSNKKQLGVAHGLAQK